jgi:hypothetical protein
VIEVTVPDEDVFRVECGDLFGIGRDVPGVRAARHPGIDKNDVPVQGRCVAGHPEPRQDDAIAANGTGAWMNVVRPEELLAHRY